MNSKYTDYKRDNFTQLPSVRETEEILAKEAKRPVALSKMNIHFADFSTVSKWLDLLGIDSRIFREDLPWEEVMNTGSMLQVEVTEKTLSADASNNPDLLKIYADISSYLGEKDVPEKADVILVFGGRDLIRVEKAVRLWKEGLAPFIIFSGGGPNYIHHQTIPEAELFKEEAIRLGVPEGRILTESRSITVPDNVRSALNFMDKIDIKHKRIIAVIVWYAIRRAWVHLMKYGPDEVVIYRTAPEHVSADYSPDGWFKNEAGIKAIFNEFVKMRVAERMNTA